MAVLPQEPSAQPRLVISIMDNQFGHACVIAAVAGSFLLPAQQVGAQQRPPIRSLGPVTHTSPPLGALSGVRPLADGQVLVNDPVRMQVLLLDSTLKVIRVVADTTAATQRSYSGRGGALVAYRADSTLLVDPVSLSMLVIDPHGAIVRVMAAPRAQDVAALLGGSRGRPGFDSDGRLIYRTIAHSSGTRPAEGHHSVSPVALTDSAPILRFDLASRKMDTAAMTKIETTELVVTHGENGGRLVPVIDPIEVVDDWAVLPDGRIAILRSDYRVEFVSADGRETAGPRIPFDWQRLTDSAKVALIDSLKATAEARRSAAIAKQSAPSGRPPLPPLLFVAPSALPDYRPAFTAGALLAAPDTTLWVRTITPGPTSSGPEYDVLDGAGRLVDRVVAPRGTAIVGFGARGAVYLVMRDAAGVHLLRAAEH